MAAEVSRAADEASFAAAVEAIGLCAERAAAKMRSSQAQPLFELATFQTRTWQAGSMSGSRSASSTRVSQRMGTGWLVWNEPVTWTFRDREWDTREFEAPRIYALSASGTVLDVPPSRSNGGPNFHYVGAISRLRRHQVLEVAGPAEFEHLTDVALDAISARLVGLEAGEIEPLGT